METETKNSELERALTQLQAAQTELRAAKQSLEGEVEVRTEELSESLRRLQLENAERLAAEEMARAGNRAKSVFLANMSHELRPPLNAILGYTDLVMEVLAEDERNDLITDLGRVHHSADHLLRIINDVLDLSRIEAGELTLHVTDLDLNPLVREVTEWIRPTVGTNTLHLHLPESNPVVRADPTHLRQVFVNLMTNAAKFTTDGDIHVRIEQNEPDYIELSVTDTGSGIPECELERIFLRFRQADNTSTRTHGGLGLGLAICRELMEAMKGALTVKSEVGVGSTFTIHCPAVHR